MDQVFEQLNPERSQSLQEFESQFGLQPASLTESQRRTRLAASWKALGGQSPRYIQDTLQAAGFDVYVHEWWVPESAPATGVKGCALARSPLQYLRRNSEQVRSGVDCGEADAACGESFAEAGNGFEPIGYPLVNKILQAEPNYIALCNEPIMECGNDLAECGQFDVFKQTLKQYVVPNDVSTFSYYLYIGGEVFGDVVSLPASRRDEFERLCLKICPCHLWLGILAQYQ